MKKKLFLLSILLLPSMSYSLSPEADAGKAQFAVCNACHNPELDPPLGAPMFGIQRRYMRAYGSKQSFIDNIVSFVKNPQIEKVQMRQAAGELGLMPALDLPDEMLRQIATYISEESFAPPCTHWEIAIKRAREKDDNNHAQHDQRNYDRFCR